MENKPLASMTDDELEMVLPHPNTPLSNDDKDYLEGVARGAWGADPRLRALARDRLAAGNASVAASETDRSQVMKNKPLASMTDNELEQEHRLWNDEIASADRWGASLTAAVEGRKAVEAEQHRRRLAKVRSERIELCPWIVDDRGVRARKVSMPVITGSGKARAERRPSSVGLVGAVAVITLLLAASWAYAIPRLVELDDRYAAMERV